MYIPDEKLEAIHMKVYRKHGYPTLQKGVRAFMRGRRWARNHEHTEKPPAGITQKLFLWAEINKEIKIQITRQEEELKNAEQKNVKTEQTGPVVKVSSEPSGD